MTGNSRHWLRAYLVSSWVSHEHIDSAVTKQALADLEAFKTGYGRLGAYHANRERLLRSIDRKVEAAQDQFALARLNPDDTVIFHDLVAHYRKELGAGNTIGRGALIVERNPYDGQKLLAVAHKHVLWSGSPIIGLRIIQQIKDQGLLKSNEYDDLEGQALGQLGDSVANFRVNYQDATNIGGSDRYIRWYKEARSAALNHDGKRVEIDYDAKFPTAEITLPNREILRRVDHPISGKIMALSKGPAFVRAEYDATGDKLVNISASSGAEVSIEYDDSDRVTQLITTGGQELRLVYNTRGKPIKISVKGKGTIQITYDDNNEITATKALGDSDEEVGLTLAWQISEAMNELLELSKLFEEAEQNVPSLPYRDDRRDALREASAELRRSDEDSQWAEAALALARYLVEHLDDDAEYVGEAHEILSDLIETSQGEDTPASRLIAGEAVTLWHRLARSTKPKGLPGDEFNQWSAMHAWLRNQAMSSDDTHFQGWFTAIDKKPLVLFPDDQWLPGSDLNNSGFWRRP